MSKTPFLTFLMLVILPFLAPAQNLDEILMAFTAQDMEVPLEVRQKMINNKGNTLLNYDNYKLVVYDKRARFLRINTPLEVTYEVAAWRYPQGGGLLVALCETRCGTCCTSRIRFFLPGEEWKEIPTEELLPELTKEDFFNVKKLEKNYLTTETVVKDFELKMQILLPQSGHDISIIFTCLDELDKKEYKRIFKYLDGSMIDLIWEKGAFKKSVPYFPAS